MDRAFVMGAALLAGLAAAGVARGMMVDMPLPMLTTESELIVVAEATKVGEPEQMRLKVPKLAEPRQGWFRTFEVKITRVIKDAAEEGAVRRRGLAVSKVGTTIALVTMAAEPRPAGAGPFPILVDGPYYPVLQVGQKYVLILRKMPEGTAWWLPAYFKNVRPESEDWLAEVTRAADVAKWPWGKAVDGLQMALLPSRQKYGLNISILRDPATGKQRQIEAVQVQMVIALRNTGPKETAVNVYAADKFLTLTAAGPGGKSVSADLYRFLAAARLATFGAWATLNIPAGGIVFIGPTGEDLYGMGQMMELTPAGKWTLSAAYANKREGGDKGTPANGNKDVPKLWTGQVQSAPAEIEVTAAPQVRR